MAEPQDPQAPPETPPAPEHMIPKSRFDEVIAERDALRAKQEETSRRVQKLEKVNRVVTTQHQLARAGVEIDEASAEFMADWYTNATKGVESPPPLIELAKSDTAPVMLRSLFAQRTGAQAAPAAPSTTPAAPAAPPAPVVRAPPPDVISGTRETPPAKSALSPEQIRDLARKGKLDTVTRRP